MKYVKNTTILSIFILMIACSDGTEKADGYGNFEATETIISSETNGKIMQFNIEEGSMLIENTFIGYIDTVQLSLKRDQLLISKKILASKSISVLSQIAVLEAKLQSLNIAKTRIENLLKDNAGTQKQLDEVDGEINIVKQQIKSIEFQNLPILNESKNIDIQLNQVHHYILKSKIINPQNGTVIAKYAEPNEITSFGKPLYKIADLNAMKLRVYLSEKQLSKIQIGQKVTIKIDDGSSMKSYDGKIIWIASEAEFTPKIIQTKEERVRLVYAVKIAVINDGSIKIGMPAEMWMSN
ncbi:MAG: HlyD family efflux transporter periplasmic adaptor subunit [Polaribacter sp.]|nr:HlyD family efflux transporter periplasmic adaptor subunit [Polaribacter sp.]MDG1812004.1 HlyD family efflux transporter periplasmic adaptor subunit [Polaribacter sp.]MDG1994592.1 HlyD family efflux transporter periplasmic adaptor subunit [Polaribacter sp.]